MMSGSKGDGQVYFDQMLDQQLLHTGYCESAGWIEGQCGQLASGQCDECERMLCHECKCKYQGGIYCGPCFITRKQTSEHG